MILSQTLRASAPDAAKQLLGCILERTIDGTIMRAKIVETEAYDQTDAASHSFKGRTPRTDVLFGPPGHLYVYFTYGMHYCCNVVVGAEGSGSAVLLRAVEPLEGATTMSERRAGKKGVELTNGPAKLCQALAITKALNDHNLEGPPLRLILQPPVKNDFIKTTTRIGITKAKQVKWRFYLKDSPYVSVDN